jgi:ribosome-binding ATPase YchF (GTP1/OBG family)
MKSITISAPDEQFDLCVEAICENKGYQSQINGGDGKVIDNPVSKLDFAKNELLAWLGDHLRSKVNKQLESAIADQRKKASEQVSAMAEVVTITVG